MPLQARMTQSDPRFYNVNRDLAHNFKFVMEAVAGRLEDEAWPELVVFLRTRGMDQDRLGQACAAFCRFVASAVERPQESMAECLDRCGWDAIPAPAQIGLMAMLGTVVSGIFFSGVREATIGGEGPALELQELRRVGAECSRLMTMPRWRRTLERLRARISRGISAIRRP